MSNNDPITIVIFKEQPRRENKSKPKPKHKGKKFKDTKSRFHTLVESLGCLYISGPKTQEHWFKVKEEKEDHYIVYVSKI